MLHVKHKMSVWYLSDIHDQSRDPPEHSLAKVNTAICKTKNNQNHHLGKNIKIIMKNPESAHTKHYVYVFAEKCFKIHLLEWVMLPGIYVTGDF